MKSTRREATNKHTYVVIMAGGRGERLWPLSTSETPKQFIKLGGKSLFQETVARAARLVRAENIYIVAPAAYRRLIQDQVELPLENVLIEPVPRSTAACIGLAAALLKREAPNSIMVVLPADHVIQKEDQFIEVLKIAVEIAAAGDRFVTLGIIPDHPATGYGYIQFDPERIIRFSSAEGEIRAYKALSFTEKPDRERAEGYLKAGNYLWNSGIFIWRMNAILQALKRYMPDLFRLLTMDLSEPEFRRGYERLEAVSIDYGVMEKAENVWVIPVDMGWSDVGDWAALEDIYDCDAQGNVVLANHLGVDTQGCVLFSERRDKLIATIGLEDLVVVDTEEALLVMKKDRAQEVREILKQLQRQGR